MAGGVSARAADYADLEALSTALRGADTLVFVSSDGPVAQVMVHHHNVIRAARASGVAHIVALSGLDADPCSTVLLRGQLRVHRAAARRERVPGLDRPFGMPGKAIVRPIAAIHIGIICALTQAAIGSARRHVPGTGTPGLAPDELGLHGASGQVAWRRWRATAGDVPLGEQAGIRLGRCPEARQPRIAASCIVAAARWLRRVRCGSAGGRGQPGRWLRPLIAWGKALDFR